MEGDWELLPRNTARRMLAYADELPTEEVCGFVLNDWKLFPVINRHPLVGSNFSMADSDVMDFMRAYRDRVTGVFHSHPGGNPHPSDNDCREWPYPELRYWIVADSDVYEWEIKDGIAFPVTQIGARGSSGLAYPVLAAPETL